MQTTMEEIETEELTIAQESNARNHREKANTHNLALLTAHVGRIADALEALAKVHGYKTL